MKKGKKKRELISTLIRLCSFLVAAFGWYATGNIIIAAMLLILGLNSMLVYKLISKKIKAKKLKNSRIDEIDTMAGVQFEHYLKELFKSRGYNAIVTTATGDYGADLVLEKDGEKIVVQAKRYSKSVGIKAIQEVHSSRTMYGASSAWVVTNNFFTKSAIDLADKSNVKLIDRNELIDYITEMNPHINPNPTEIKQEIKPNIKKACTSCGSPMVLRKGYKGVFYGCSSFPNCRNTMQES